MFFQPGVFSWRHGFSAQRAFSRKTGLFKLALPPIEGLHGRIVTGMRVNNELR